MTATIRTIDKRLAKAKEVSKLLNVAVSTVYEWARMDFIPHINIGTGKKKPCVRFDADEVREWMEARKRQGRTTRLPLQN